MNRRLKKTLILTAAVLGAPLMMGGFSGDPGSLILLPALIGPALLLPMMMMLRSTDDDQDDEVINGGTMLFMAVGDEKQKELKNQLDDMAAGGKTISFMRPSLQEEVAARPAAAASLRPMPQEDELEELAGKTIMFMPSQKGAQDEMAEQARKRLDEMMKAADVDQSDSSRTMAFMPSAGQLPVDKAMAEFERVEEPTMDLLPKEEPKPARPKTALSTPKAKTSGSMPAVKKPMTTDMEFIPVGRNRGRIAIIIILLTILGLGGVFVGMLFDLIPRPEAVEFLKNLPHYEIAF